MASLYPPPQKAYRDKKSHLEEAEYNAALEKSNTVYVGNLALYTTDDQIYELFSRVGYVQKVIIGLRNDSLPAGFAFVVYGSHAEAVMATSVLNQSKLDARRIRVDMDTGLDLETRNKGRGIAGRQWRDVFREGNDPGRGEGMGLSVQDVNNRMNNKRPRDFSRNHYRRDRSPQRDQRDRSPPRRERSPRRRDSWDEGHRNKGPRYNNYNSGGGSSRHSGGATKYGGHSYERPARHGDRR